MGKTLQKIDNPQVTAFKNNDRQAMQKVYEHTYSKFRNHVFKNSGNEAEAKDIFQDAFVACWRNIKDDKFDGTGSIEAYLYTIARNKWTDHLRSARFRKTVGPEGLSKVVQEEGDDLGADLDTKRQTMLRALDQLGDACQQLLGLFYYERKTMKQVAKDLGIAAASARNKKYRCMERLRSLAEDLTKNG